MSAGVEEVVFTEVVNQDLRVLEMFGENSLYCLYKT